MKAEIIGARENATKKPQSDMWNKRKRKTKTGIFGPDFSERSPPSWSRLTTGVDQRNFAITLFSPVSLSLFYLSTSLSHSLSISPSLSLSFSRSLSLPISVPISLARFFFFCIIVIIIGLSSRFTLSSLAHRNYNSLFFSSYI